MHSLVEKHIFNDVFPADAIIKAGKMLDNIRNFVAIFYDEKLNYINPAGLKMLGYEDAAEVSGSALADFLHIAYKDIGDIGLANLVEEDGILVKFYRHKVTPIDVHLWVSKLTDIGDNIYMLEAREMTKHLRSAADLQVREQHLQSVLNAVPDCILTLDADRHILSANPATAYEFDLSPDDLIYTDIAELIPHLEGVDLSTLINSSWDRTYQGDKYWFGNRKKTTFPVEIVVRSMLGGRFTCIVRNVEERVQAEAELHRHMQDLEHNQHLLEGQASEAVYLAEELEIQKSVSEHQALHDPLTDLPNRRYFQKFLTTSITSAKQAGTSVCLLFIDLDKFKEVNDTLGHDIGDNLLIKVSAYLKKNTRSQDMVARLGGDEFAVILNSKHQIDEKTYSDIATRILKDLNISVLHDKETINTSASIGAAIYPKNAIDVDSLIKVADKTMYESKENGRNQVIFAS